MTGDPTRHLTSPRAPRDIPELALENLGMLFDFVSPSAWVNELIKETTGVDVYAECVQPLAGDWEAFGRYCNTLGNISAALGEIATDVQDTTLALDRHWSGNAANAAHAYFSATAASLRDHEVILQKVSEQYHQTAYGTWMFAEQLKSVLQLVVDRVIYAGVCAAAGSALIETGVGAIVGYAGAAYFVADAMAKINKCTQITATAIQAIYGSWSGILQLTRELEDLGPIPVMNGPYIHPAIGAQR